MRRGNLFLATKSAHEEAYVNDRRRHPSVAAFKVTKILVLVVVLALLSVAFTAFAVADPPEGNKVDICHYQAKDKIIDGELVPAGWYLIEVSTRSVNKHIAKHADASGVRDFVHDGTASCADEAATEA